MDREVKLNHLDTVLETVEYPITRDSAITAFEDVTLILADGTEQLSEILRTSSVVEFESVSDLTSELMNLLPQHAVGEPYQSEGDA